MLTMLFSRATLLKILLEWEQNGGLGPLVLEEAMDSTVAHSIIILMMEKENQVLWELDTDQIISL